MIIQGLSEKTWDWPNRIIYERINYNMIFTSFKVDSSENHIHFGDVDLVILKQCLDSVESKHSLPLTGPK